MLALALVLPSHAEDGYRLWLRYEKVEDAGLLESYAKQATEIVVRGETPTLNAARSELETGLSGLLGRKVPLATGVTRDGAVVVNIQTGRSAEPLTEDGYSISTEKTPGGKTVTLITGNSEHAGLYGAFHFLRLIQTQQPIRALKLAENPKLQRRILNHWDNLNGSVERGYAGKSIWKWDELPAKVDPRYRDYARACASIGINGAVLNNVNAKPEQLSPENLLKAAAIANELRPYGIHVYLSANFAAPQRLGGLPNADPRNPEVRKWWKNTADEIYKLIPDFGGLLVKANSEGQPGPQDYDLTHAEGANLLAESLAPHGGIVMWRAFVYNSPKVDGDRAKRAYLEFMPVDGLFHSTVIVQAKNGPIDFQPREPFHPLFGAMKKTPLMPELEITQENMGHSTDLVYLGPMWQEFLGSDTDGKGTRVGETLDDHPMSAIAGVANTGTDRNWCGHHFAQANWYAYGRLAWDGGLKADDIANEWVRMTWGNDPKVLNTAMGMMKGSWEALVNYEMPIGLHHIMEGGGHFDPAPQSVNKSAPEYSAWYYHKADKKGIGFDRTRSGSGGASQYAGPVAAKFEDLETCPDELLLWFHHVEWDHRMKSGRTVWEDLCFRYNDGVSYVEKMQDDWQSLGGKIDPERFIAVSGKLEKQLKHAIKWRDTCIRYFQSVNGKDMPAYLKP